LLRIVRKPVQELRSRIGPLVKAATTGGASLADRASTLGSIVGMLGRAQKTQSTAASDPVERQRQRLSIPDAERDELEREIENEVQTAVASAMRSLEASS
jgi:hypothetical protein